MGVFMEIKEKLPGKRVLEHFLGPSRGQWHCPFHEDHTPSLSAKGPAIKCFGCQWTGDIFKFVKHYEGIDTREALKILADLAGVNIDNYTVPMRKTPRIFVLQREMASLRYKIGELQGDVIRIAQLNAANKWKEAWRKKHLETIWDLVEVAARIDREIEIMKMRREKSRWTSSWSPHIQTMRS